MAARRGLSLRVQDGAGMQASLAESTKFRFREKEKMRGQDNTISCPTCHHAPSGRSTGHITFGGRLQTCPTCEGSGQLQPTPARIPIWYIVHQVIGANATIPASLQILAQADFEWVFTASSQTSSLLNVTMFDGSTGRLITQPQNTQNINVGVLPISLFAGTAQLPFPLLEPYIIARASTVQFYLTDTSGAQNTIDLALIGFQLIPQNAQTQGSAGMIQIPRS
jgi:hypothetical protein